jgi:membrane associated rhomboid family serine protease
MLKSLMPRIHITPVVLNLIIINALVFIALPLFPSLEAYFVLLKSDLFFARPAFIASDGQAVGFMPVQLVTSLFSHANFLHILLNMFALFQFGPTLETMMGSRRFLAAYLTIGLVQMLLTAFLDPSPAPVVGASGALFGIMVVFAYYFPQTRLGLMFLPISFPVRNFMIGSAAISALLIILEETSGRSMGNISHFGHLSGMVAGFAYLHMGKLRKLGK